jgi:phosphatidate cytidylyltransferase
MLKRTVVALAAGVLFILAATYSFWTALFCALVVHTLCTVEFARLTPRLCAWRVGLHTAGAGAVLIASSLSLMRIIPAAWIAVALAVMMLGHAAVAVAEYERTGSCDSWALLRSLLFITLPLALLAPVSAWPGPFPYLVLLIGASWGADTGAIWAGKAIGRRKLAPRLSPNKTVEGLIGGVLSSGATWAMATALYPLPELGARLGLDLLPQWALIALMFVAGMAAALSGVLGDLTFSLFKRQAGLKDYGHILPGHGGMLDRVDSFIFAAPVVFLLCLL